MAHFAVLDEDNVVNRVIVVSNDDIIDETGKESEELGVSLCEKLLGPGKYVQTSFGNNFRRRYAGIGFIYDEARDAFIKPKPYPSWVLDEDDDWVAPKPYPTGVGDYQWSEPTLQWVLIPESES